MAESADTSLLPMIEAALAAQGWFPSMPLRLATLFEAEQHEERRAFNRRLLPAFWIVFDLFWLGQFKSAPELVPLSGLLRVIYTGCILMFTALDKRARLGRLYKPLLLALSVAPAIISAVLCLRTTSTTTLADLHATPLILLSGGVTVRMPARDTLVMVLITSTCFIGSILLNQVVPRAELGSLILTEVAVAASVITIGWRLDWRDRRVFLLNLREQIGRSLILEQNRGLLLEIHTDVLTDIANRRGFEARLGAAWYDCLERALPLSVIMMDIDHFKLFNDHYGHQGGDACLERVARAAASQVRGCDLIARYGGEEFAVILPQATAPVAASIAERIRSAVHGLRLPHTGLQTDGVVTISLGVATGIPSETHGVRTLVEAADRNLYAAKRAGRNRVVWDAADLQAARAA